MRDIESLLRDGVEAAWEAQGRDVRPASADVKRRVIGRGRRRRLARIAGSAALSVVLVAGAASAGSELLQRQSGVAARQVPELGAERVLGGGAIATDGSSLWVGDGKVSNGRGDLNSVARMDLATGEVVNGDPAVAVPHAMAVGDSGIWTVAWEGDMPVGGEGSPVRGVIQRVDPLTLERTAHIPRELSAPYDVAVGEVAGRETAWVVDAGRDQLLQVDAELTSVETAHETPSRPDSVYVHGRFVYVTSSRDHVVMRLDVTNGRVTEIPVPDCANQVEVAAGFLWVTDYCGNALHRIDEDAPGDIVSIDVGPSPSGLEFAEGLVWVATRDGVVRVDPETNERVGETVYVSEFFHGDILYAGGALWASDAGGVYRIAEDVPPAGPAPTPPPTADPRDEPLPAGAERVDVSGHPRAVAAGEDSIWVGEWDVRRIDTESGDALATVDLGQSVMGLDLDEEAGLLWALVEIAEKEKSVVVAIDAGTNEVVLEAVPVEPSNVSGQHLDAAGGAAWVPGRRGVLTRVDAGGDVTELDLSEHFDEDANAEGSFHVAATREAVLVIATDGTVVRVDPASGTHEKVEELGWNTADVVTDGTTVWVAQQAVKGELVLLTLDPRTGTRTGDPVKVGEYGFVHAAEHGGTVWVAQGGATDGTTVVRAYRAGAGKPVRTVELPGAEFMTDVAAGPSGVWLTTGDDFLYRLTLE